MVLESRFGLGFWVPFWGWILGLESVSGLEFGVGVGSHVRSRGWVSSSLGRVLSPGSVSSLKFGVGVGSRVHNQGWFSGTVSHSGLRVKFWVPRKELFHT